MSPKRYTCHPRGMYLLGIPLAHTSWVTCIPLALHHTVCYPRGIHAPKRYGLPEMQSKRYTQEVYPRGIYLLGCMHTSWVYLLGCSHTSWVAYLLGIPLGLHHTSWVAGVLLMYRDTDDANDDDSRRFHLGKVTNIADGQAHVHCYATKGKALSRAEWRPLYQTANGVFRLGNARHCESVMDHIPLDEDEWVWHYNV